MSGALGVRLGGESECEIRPFFEYEDFGPSAARILPSGVIKAP